MPEPCLTHTPGALTEKYVAELACQYGEAVNLRAILTAVLTRLEETEANAASLCECTDLDTATGECLTALGAIAGWPRTHCAAQCVVSFGFACPGDPCANDNILGWCSGEWFCGSTTAANKDYTFVDDELYRRFIKARIAARDAVGTATEALAAARALLGTDVCLGRIEGGVVEIIVPRLLSTEERSILELVRRVIPAALGTEVVIIHSNGPPFGFACPGSPCEPAGWCVGAFGREVTAIC